MGSGVGRLQDAHKAAAISAGLSWEWGAGFLVLVRSALVLVCPVCWLSAAAQVPVWTGPVSSLYSCCLLSLAVVKHSSGCKCCYVFCDGVWEKLEMSRSTLGKLPELGYHVPEGDDGLGLTRPHPRPDFYSRADPLAHRQGLNSARFYVPFCLCLPYN